MKSVFFISVFVFAIMTHYSSAQMGHGMMRNTQDMKKERMMDQGHMKDQERVMEQNDIMEEMYMMEHEKMMGNMMGITQDISIMMSEMSDMIGNMSIMSREQSRGSMQKMSEIMKKMSAEMIRMSWIMNKGIITDEEMKTMYVRILKMQKQLTEMR